MDFILGLLSAVVFFAVYSMGVKHGQKHSKPNQEVDEESEKKAKELYDDFQAMMNYDVQTATKRKQVI